MTAGIRSLNSFFPDPGKSERAGSVTVLTRKRDHEEEICHQYVNFVSLMQTYAEIEKSGLVRSRNSGDRCFYRITSDGRQTLRIFKADLGREITKQADDFLRSEGTVLRSEQSVRADCIPAENGMYNVILKVMERTDSVMEIRLQVPDKGLAEAYNVSDNSNRQRNLSVSCDSLQSLPHLRIKSE